jgi:hypothetical protein
VQVEHGRIGFLTDRGPVLGTSATIVFVVLVPVVSPMVATAIPRVVGGERSILSRRGGGRKVKIQEFVCIWLLLIPVCTLLLLMLLLLLAMFRVATHCEFQISLFCLFPPAVAPVAIPTDV